MENRTKIIGTIGPSSENEATLRAMIEGGMDAVRLNFSHGTYEQFAAVIARVRRLAKLLNRHIAIIQDLQGPKIRVGKLSEGGITVKKGQRVVLISIEISVPRTAGQRRPSEDLAPPGRAKAELIPTEIPFDYRPLAKEVKTGQTLLIDDGLIELRVDKINAEKTEIACTVKVAGVIKSHKGINVPGAHLSAPSLSEKDRKDIQFGLLHGVDFIALSFVKEAKDILELKKIIARGHSRAKVISKIERHEAMQNLAAIVQAADAVMVARGDLGLEIPAEQVPLAQKNIIHLCNGLGKPVIVATHLLSSMVSNPRPTRAEISDAANAIFDHADALMLSNETAVGKYPVEAIRTLSRVARATENNLKLHEHLLRLPRPEQMPVTDATCLNATKLAHDIGAKFIVAITRSGYTAREISKYRTYTPVIVFTPDVHAAREMSLVWGVTSCFVQFIHLDNPLPQIRKTLLAAKFVKKGDELVICNAGFSRTEKLITTTVL